MNPAISPDGKFVAYASNQGGNFDIWVKAIDSPSRPIQITSDPAHDWQPDWSPDGNRIVFRSERDGGGLYIVPAFGGFEHRLVTFGYVPRWSPDGTKVLFSTLLLEGTGRGDLHFVSVKNGNVQPLRLSDLPDGVSSAELGWHADSTRVTLFFTTGLYPNWAPAFVTIDVDRGTSTRSRIDQKVLDGFREQRIFPTPNESLVWAPTGRSIYFVGRSRGVVNIFAVDTDPQTLAIIGGPHRLTTMAETNEGLSLSRDGRRLVLGSANRNPRVWVYTVDPSGKQIVDREAVSDAKAFALSPDLAADGRKLVFVKQRRGSGTGRSELAEVLLGPPIRERVLLVTEGGKGELRSFPRWSPDGKWIVYRLLRPGTTGLRIRSLVLLNILTGAEKQLTTPVPEADSQEVAYGWSPDGAFVVSSTTRFTRGGIAIVLLPVSSAPAAETRPRIITESSEGGIWNTGMSPDKKWICFQAVKGEVSRVAVVRASANRASRSEWIWLTSDEGWSDKPRWSTDGHIIYYISRRGGIFNVWGLGFNSTTGSAVGAPFQITDFDGLSGQMIPADVGDVELGVSGRRLAIPIIQPTGGIWMLENVR